MATQPPGRRLFQTLVEEAVTDSGQHEIMLEILGAILNSDREHQLYFHGLSISILSQNAL